MQEDDRAHALIVESKNKNYKRSFPFFHGKEPSAINRKSRQQIDCNRNNLKVDLVQALMLRIFLEL